MAADEQQVATPISAKKSKALAADENGAAPSDPVSAKKSKKKAKDGETPVKRKRDSTSSAEPAGEEATPKKKSKKASGDSAEEGSAKKSKKKPKKSKEPEAPTEEPEKEDFDGSADASTSSDEANGAGTEAAGEVDGSSDSPEEPPPADEEDREDDPNSLDNFRLSPAVKAALRRKSITSLFPIQVQTFDLAMDGIDIIARARTGQGKTLAFVLPIVERLKMLKESGGKGAGAGFASRSKLPSVIVLAPTRELAKQVGDDFEYIGRAAGMSVVCVYGGAPMGPQERALFRGVDIVVGTPGRIKDLLQRGSLKLNEVRFRVLDEADEMLDMGFVDDVETILKSVDDQSKVQTLLFSATVPEWVNKISKRFFREDKRVVDLVGGERQKASTNVRHLLMPCHTKQRFQLVADVIATYSLGGKVILFVDTKSAASEYAQNLAHLGARALHGDVVQQQREVVLKAFKSGAFQVLVATDVAARGLDISDVQLVLQAQVPRTVETYIHRSGRTGRAGNTGVSVLVADRWAGRIVAQIEHTAGVKFERVSPPQPADLVKVASAAVTTKVKAVGDSVVPLFEGSAQELIESTGLSPLAALAKALACLAGHTELKARSLLLSQQDQVTLLLRCVSPFYSPSYVLRFFEQHLTPDQTRAINGITLTADGCGAVFDVPVKDKDLYLKVLEAQEDGEEAEGEGEEGAAVGVAGLVVVVAAEAVGEGDMGETGGVVVVVAADGGVAEGNGQGVFFLTPYQYKLGHFPRLRLLP
ncbi:unnamed protein product [Closterium sp. Yama58-4]|nr:unnamed protein product [Closterium sp. Yama58-4]